MVIVKIDGKIYDIYGREKAALDKAYHDGNWNEYNIIISAIKRNHNPVILSEYKSKPKR